LMPVVHNDLAQDMGLATSYLPRRHHLSLSRFFQLFVVVVVVVVVAVVVVVLVFVVVVALLLLSAPSSSFLSSCPHPRLRRRRRRSRRRPRRRRPRLVGHLFFQTLTTSPAKEQGGVSICRRCRRCRHVSTRRFSTPFLFLD